MHRPGLARLALLAALACAACGTPPEPGGPGGASASGARDGGAPSAEDRAAKASALSQNAASFARDCERAAPGAQAFCSCMWEDARRRLGDDVLADPGIDPRALERIKPAVVAVCKDKMPEETVHSVFVASCTGERADVKPYCDCMWSEFRKTLSPAELADGDTVQTERFKGAHAAAVKACGTSIPEPAIQDRFLAECGQDPRGPVFCACAWKTLRELASVAEIQSGSYDRDKATAKVDAACGKPKK